MQIPVLENHNRLELIVPESLCDFKMEIFPQQMLAVANEVAAEHMERSAKLAMKQRLAAKLAWMISGYSFVFRSALPKKDEKLIVETWSDGLKAARFKRNHLFYKDNTNLDQVFAAASSEWFLFNWEQDRPVKPLDVIDDQDQKLWVSDFAGLSGFKVKRLKGLLSPAELEDIDSTRVGSYFTRDFIVDYSDLDANFHLNNTRYVAFSLNTLFHYLLGNDSQLDFPYRLKELHLNFVAEVLPLEQLRIFLKEETDFSVESLYLEVNNQKIDFSTKLPLRSFKLEGFNLDKQEISFRAQIIVENIDN